MELSSCDNHQLVKDIDTSATEKPTLKESSKETLTISSNEMSAENVFDQSKFITVQEDVSLEGAEK